ncbi:MAG: hypothetical protein L3J59_16520, partial [Methylococcaceae bacterium]|nr:hypothetical protein [Methylococcaceae bacterium]
MKTITTLTDTTAMAAVRHEIGLENEYRQIGLAFNLNELMLADGKYQQFTIKYSKFSKKGLETPPSFSELGSHIHDFVEINDFTDDKATNAGI